MDDETMRATRKGSDLGIRRRDEKRFNEGLAATETSWLQADADVSGCGGGGFGRKPNQANAVLRTRHAITIGQQLLGDSTVADDHTGNGGGVIGAHKDAAGSETGNVVGVHNGERRGKVGRETEETDAVRMMGVTPGIKEADLGTGSGEGSIQEEKDSVTGRTGHGTVVGVCKDGARGGVVCFGETAKQETLGVDGRDIWSVTERDCLSANGIKEGERVNE